jgi:hypothetical protein
MLSMKNRRIRDRAYSISCGICCGLGVLLKRAFSKIVNLFSENFYSGAKKG